MSERSRAALLPTPGDPFLVSMWLDLYKERWADQVDQLYVYVNTERSELYGFFYKLIEEMPHTTLIWSPRQIEHGDAINRLLDECSEENVMLIEDDAFVFNGNEIDRCFNSIEDGTFDVVGSKRGSASTWLINQENQKYGLRDEGFEGDTGPNFWPNFLFTKKQFLLDTDRNFAAKTWQAGEEVSSFNIQAPSLIASDTFVWASMQLRDVGLRIGYVKQYHGAPEDLDHHQTGKNLFDGQCPWVHVGSLSSGLGGFLSDNELPNYANAEYERWELERRISFWEMSADHYANSNRTGLGDLLGQYMGWIERLIGGYKLSRKNIERRKAIYRELMSWT